MRYDMDKVVTERPRSRGKGGQRGTYSKATRPRDKDILDCGVENDQRPRKESMRKRHVVNGDPKEFSDLLGPLEKFLFSRVGQPWNNVWSEICKVLKGNSLQAFHIKGHVKQMVGGIPHSGETFFLDTDWFSPGFYYSGRAVYVNEEGILCKSEERSWKREKEVYHYFRESDTVEYHKLNGCWFWVEIGSSERDNRYKGLFRSYTRRETYHFVINKRALSKKEAKKLGLNKKTETRAPKLILED